MNELLKITRPNKNKVVHVGMVIYYHGYKSEKREIISIESTYIICSEKSNYFYEYKHTWKMPTQKKDFLRAYSLEPSGPRLDEMGYEIEL